MINRRFGYTISVMNGDFMKNIKKILHTFTAAVMAVSTLAFSAVCIAQGAEQSAQADVLYAESFANSNIKSGYVLVNVPKRNQRHLSEETIFTHIFLLRQTRSI